MSSPEQPEPAVSFDDFLKKIEPKLKRVLSLYRIPGDDAEDVLQQALLTLLYQWDRVREPECWLLGTLRRHCMMYWRTHRRRFCSAVDSTLLEWLSEPVAPPQERADLLSDLESLIGRLPTRCRSLLLLRFQLGYEPVEIAQRLGYQPSSIGKVTTRCLEALGRKLVEAGLADELPENPEGEDAADDPPEEAKTG